ncbi:MAG: hypothetical protein GY755_19775 [Chloroflexi bacterium]|nr:hypothetical protein [Chloroflexota bacterium]
MPGICEPLSAKNKLIFAPRLMVGHRLSSCDRLPEWMTREPVAPTNTVFDVSEEDLDNLFNW